MWYFVVELKGKNTGNKRLSLAGNLSKRKTEAEKMYNFKTYQDRKSIQYKIHSLQKD